MAWMPACPRETLTFRWIIWRVSTGANKISGGISGTDTEFLDFRIRCLSPKFLPDNLRNQFAGDVG